MLYFLCIIPPIAVLFTGQIFATLIASILTLFFYIPGVIYALVVVNKHYKRENLGGDKTSSGKSKKISYDKNKHAEERLGAEIKDKNEFIKIIKSHLQKSFDYSNLENSKFISFVIEYMGNKKELSKQFYFLYYINPETLFKGYKNWANFDVEKEIPLVYYYAPGMFEKEGLLITNKYFYYNLSRSTNYTETDIASDRVPLKIIEKFATHFHKNTFALTVNDIMIGAFPMAEVTLTNLNYKKQGSNLEDFMNEMISRRFELFDFKEKQDSLDNLHDTVLKNLERLKKLKDEGVLTEEEFQKKKIEILSMS